MKYDHHDRDQRQLLNTTKTQNDHLRIKSAGQHVHKSMWYYNNIIELITCVKEHNDLSYKHILNYQLVHVHVVLGLGI